MYMCIHICTRRIRAQGAHKCPAHKTPAHEGQANKDPAHKSQQTCLLCDTADMSAV